MSTLADLRRPSLERQLRVLGVWPCAIVSVLLCGWFTWDRIGLLDASFDAGGRALARSIAAACDLSLFAGDRETLQRIGQSAIKEQSIAAVEIEGRDADRIRIGQRPEGEARVYAAPVRFRPVQPLEDYGHGAATVRPEQIGTVQVVLDTRALIRQKRHSAVVGASIALMTLLFAAVFARRLARRVTEPLAQLSATVADIRTGRLEARSRVCGVDELGRLALGVNAMAESLERHHRELEARVEDATREAMQRLKQAEIANAAKARFLAAASHDLRQPLHALGFFVASLRGGARPDQQPVIERIDEGLNAISGLLNALLDISRLDADVLRPARRSVPVQSLFDAQMALSAPLAAQTQVRLRFRPSRLHVDTDPVLAARVIGNLVTNAVQYARGGTVLMAARRRGGRVRIEIRDNGIGIAPLHHERVFDEFFQIDNPERDRRKGLGLGLAICTRVARLLGGGIGLRSALGRGSTFWFELPSASAAAVVEPSPPAVPAAGPALALRGLLVDDDRLIRDATGALLTAWGCEITRASTAREAIEAIETMQTRGLPYDFVLSDLQLEQIDDGWQVIEYARDHSPQTRLLLVSGNTQRETLQGARSRDITLLTKPVAPARLRAALARRPAFDPA